MIEKTVEIILLIAAFAGIGSIVLASVYDVKKIRLEPALRIKMHRLSKRFQPHVTIITQADTPSDLDAHLRHISRSHYWQYDVVAIVSRCTLAERRTLLKSSPVENLRIYVPRKKHHDAAVLADAYKLSKRGEMVVLLDGRDILEPIAIKQSVAILQQAANIESLRFISTLQPIDSMTGLYDVFAELSERIFGKVLSVFGIIRRRPVGYSGIYRSSNLLSAIKKGASVSTVDGCMFAESNAPSPALSSNSRWTTWLGRLTFIALVFYGAVSAALLQNPLPLLLMWAIVSIWLLAVVWSETAERATSKFAISVCIPIGMFVITSVYIVGSVYAASRYNIFRFLRTFSHTNTSS